MVMVMSKLTPSPFAKHDENDYFILNEEKEQFLKEKSTLTTFNLPRQTAILLCKLLAHCKKDSKIVVKSTGNQVEFNFHNSVLEFQLKSTVNEGRFLDYHQVIPSFIPCELPCPKGKGFLLHRRHLPLN